MCSQEAKFSFDSLSEKFFLAYLNPNGGLKMAIEALGEGLPKSCEHPKLNESDGRMNRHSLWLSIVFIQPSNDTQECKEKRKIST